MPFDQTAILGMIKRIHLFQGVDDEKLIAAIALMEQVEIPAGQIIYKVEDAPEYFYLVLEGQVRTSRYDRQAGQVVQMGVFGPEDYFGEEVLENDWSRQINAETVSSCHLLRISVPNFIVMLDLIPPLAKRLQLILDSYRLLLKNQFSWLDSNETIYFVARKHQLFLFVMILPPVLAGLFGLMIFGVWYLATPMITNLILLVGSALAALVWLVWSYIDWSNDYYFITNQRVVYQERVILLYDSRQESPIQAVQSTTINTSQWGRWLGYGNVAIRTYIGTILFRSIAYPEHVQVIVQQHQVRSQNREVVTEIGRIKGWIDKRIRTGPEQVALPKAAKPPAPPPDPTRAFLSTMFHLRYEQGGTVTFRTHWFILFQKVFFPSLILIGLFAIFVYSALNPFTPMSIQATCGVLFLFFMIIFAWWFYQYMDWHNDVYVITPEQIVDVNKKPLGREERQAAPIKNILSIEYKRLGILGLLLNFGTVFIRVGDQTLTFDNVLNPSEVQRELFHCLARKNYEEKVKQGDADRKRMTEWIATYNEWAKENQTPPRSSQPPARPGF